MEIWQLEYWCDSSSIPTVRAWLDRLSDEQLKSVAKEVKLLELCGHELRLPHSRALGKGLFELRERKFGYRLYYTFRADRVIVLLHAGDKNSQQKDIKIARQRQLKLKMKYQ